jgi:AbiV family abortive infection protein
MAPRRKATVETASVSSDYLLHGAVFALEQCGLLLSHARTLHCSGESGAYASAMALAAFAREELGRYKILRELWKRTISGETFSVKQIRDQCDDHVEKQREGMLSVMPRGSGLGRLLQTYSSADHASPEWQNASEELDRMIQSQRRRTPEDRHNLRMRALYVEPLPTGWNKPAEISEVVARDFLVHAINDYSLASRNLEVLVLKRIDPNFYAALEQWQDRPELKPPPFLHQQ